MKQSELLRKQADMMDMVEKYGIEHWTRLVKVKDSSRDLYTGRTTCSSPINAQLCDDCLYTFALGVVEGKPVFEGDELYNTHAGKVKIAPFPLSSETFVASGYGHITIKDCSWNPPKPKTVMVELTVEEASFLANPIKGQPWDVVAKIEKAAKKALEERK